MRGGAHLRSWDQKTYLLADLVDAVRENTYVFLRANMKKNTQIPAPEPVPRPTEKTEKKSKPNLFAVMASKYINKRRAQKQEERR